MGLSKPSLRLLALEHLHRPFEGTVVTLGRQCVYATLAECQKILLEVGVTPCEVPPHSQSHAQIPSWLGTERERFTTDRAFFALLGVDECVALDCSDYEGAEITFDLNNPLQDALRSRADVLIDGGTLEHVFDVRQALTNVSLMLRPGGRIIHMSPANNYTNHGFYQFSPTLYADYYRANRFKNVRVFAVEERLRAGETASWDLYELDQTRQPLMMSSATPRRMLTLCIAEPGDDSTVGEVPTQSSYAIEFAKSTERTDGDPGGHEPKLWFNRLAKRVMPNACYFALRGMWSKCQPLVFGDPTKKPWGLKRWKLLR